MTVGDLIATVDGELMVAHIEACSDRGRKFLDAHLHDEMSVLDSGRIMVPQDHLPELRAEAAELGLRWTP